jgi:hypothetical protein
VRDSLLIVGAAVLIAVVPTACGLCGRSAEVQAPSPDGRHVARSYLHDCGATTGYTTRVDIQRKGGDWAPVYFAAREYELRLHWVTPRELRIDCDGCPPRHPSAPPVEGVAISVVNAAVGSNASGSESAAER